MSATKIVLDRQAIARIFGFGTNAAGGEALVTIEKGTQAASTVVLDVKGSTVIGGDLNLIGNLNLTGSINEQNVTNLAVVDKNITLNKGGTSVGADSGGIDIEGDSAAVVGAVRFDSSKLSKFTMGNGTAQNEVVVSGNSQAATAGYVLMANGAGTAPTFQAIPTVTPVYNRLQTVTGTQDGTNRVFTLSTAVLSGTEMVFVNGAKLRIGASNDYVINVALNQITFNAGSPHIPQATDSLEIYGVN